MDKISQHRQSALKSIQTAKYLLSTTYPLLKEPKTLLMISSHVFDSFMSSVSMLLIFERSKKTILPYHENNDSKINSFRQLVKKYDFKEHYDAITSLINLSKEHKESVLEFSKDKKYIMCSKEFQKIQSVSETDMKNYIGKAAEFFEKVNNVVSNE